MFTHTQHCVDALVALPEWTSSSFPRRRLLMFAVLAHDFGKPSTTAYAEKRGAMRWISPGHESAGGPLAKNFLRRIGAPLDYDDPVGALVVYHLAHHHGQAQYTDTSIRRLARKLAPATIDDLALVMRSDANGRPPLKSPEIHERIDELVAKAHGLAIADSAPKPIVLGRHLIELGLKPGPKFTPIIDAAFEAQLDGAFNDEVGGVAWLRTYLKRE